MEYIVTSDDLRSDVFLACSIVGAHHLTHEQLDELTLKMRARPGDLQELVERELQSMGFTPPPGFCFYTI